MVCFGLLHSRYDTEMFLIYDTEALLLYLLLVDIVAWGLYFDSHILFVLIIFLILIILINCINFINVRESYEYSLTANKSLL